MKIISAFLFISLLCPFIFAEENKPSPFSTAGAMSGTGFMGPPIPTASYEGRVLPANESPGLTENRVTVSVPVYKSLIDTISLAATTGDLHFSRPTVLDNTGTVVAANFYRDEIGGLYFHQLENERAWGFRGSIGSASDKPFEANRDISFSFGANYTFPAADKNRWVLLIFFSNNSPLGDYVPVPGFIYVYKTEKLIGLFGFPIASVQWMPSDPWSYSLSIFGPIMSAEAAYGHVNKFQTFAGFTWTRQLYMPSDRNNDKDRLTVEEKKTMLGFRMPIVGSMLGEFQLGESFDRSLYIGSKTFDKDGGSATLDSGVYVSWNFKASF